MKSYILDYLNDKKEKIKGYELMKETYKKAALHSLEIIEDQYRNGLLTDDEAARKIANV